jgi:teichuronic acid biosynthesis glycosyltransferase TuaC
VRVVAPLGVPPWPLYQLHPRYAALRASRSRRVEGPARSIAPVSSTLPGTGGRFHGAMLARAVTPLLERIRRDFAFDVINAEFFFPDGVAAVELGRRFGVPVSIKARGSDIHQWTKQSRDRPPDRRGGASGGRSALRLAADARRHDRAGHARRSDRVHRHRRRSRPLRTSRPDRGQGSAGHVGPAGPLGRRADPAQGPSTS